MSLSSSEIKAVVEELKFLEESYFSKMQFIDDRIYRLRFKTGDVIINPAEELHLTEYKLVGRPPDANLRFVRKVLKGIKL